MDSKIVPLVVQHYVIKYVRNLLQVGCFLRVLRFPLTNKTNLHDITEILLKEELITIKRRVLSCYKTKIRQSVILFQWTQKSFLWLYNFVILSNDAICCWTCSRPEYYNYVIKYVRNLLQVGCFLRVLRFPPTNKTNLHDITEILLKEALNTINITKPNPPQI
jgi:hypothetical protein